MTQKSKNKAKKLCISRKSSIFASYFAQTCAYVRIRKIKDERSSLQNKIKIHVKKRIIHNAWNVVIGDANNSAKCCGNGILGPHPNGHHTNRSFRQYDSQKS